MKLIINILTNILIIITFIIIDNAIVGYRIRVAHNRFKEALEEALKGYIAPPTDVGDPVAFRYTGRLEGDPTIMRFSGPNGEIRFLREVDPQTLINLTSNDTNTPG